MPLTLTYGSKCMEEHVGVYGGVMKNNNFYGYSFIFVMLVDMRAELDCNTEEPVLPLTTKKY